MFDTRASSSQASHSSAAGARCIPTGRSTTLALFLCFWKHPDCKTRVQSCKSEIHTVELNCMTRSTKPLISLSIIPSYACAMSQVVKDACARRLQHAAFGHGGRLNRQSCRHTPSSSSPSKLVCLLVWATAPEIGQQVAGAISQTNSTL